MATEEVGALSLYLCSRYELGKTWSSGRCW